LDSSDIPPHINELSVLITDDDEIEELNTAFRNKAKPTDVLSFPAYNNKEDANYSPSIGDLVISLETATRQAKEYGVTLDQELLRLLIHGTLHLFGYDHENVSSEEKKEMEKLEDTFFSKLKDSTFS